MPYHDRRSFNSGEFSERVLSRDDLDKYNSGCEKCENFRALIYGGVERRTGLSYIGEIKDSSKDTILVPFVVSTTVKYILEIGNQYIRFYRD